MHLYTAAVYTNGYRAGGNSGRYAKLTDHEKSITDSVPHLLESYHYVHGQRFVDAMREDNVRVFLDSGAFSIADYCDYIQRNADIIRVEDGSVMASVLDGIGDPLQTYRNQLEMEARGVRPLPCFHFGEDERYLEHYIQNYDYITIGGMVGRPVPQLITWLDRIWNKHMVDGSGRPRIKIHAFGITSIRIMESYPWYSCDSSSWVQTAAFGNIMMPESGPISVSDKSPSRHEAGRHLTTLSPLEREHLESIIEINGFDFERLSTVYESRAAWNLWAYMQINAYINAGKGAKYRTHVQELF